MDRSKTIVKLNTDELQINHGPNAIFGGNYREDLDIQSMVGEIEQVGKILEPVHVLDFDGRKILLRGNRRVAAAQRIRKDPNASAELKTALEKIEAFVYKDGNEREVTEFVLDQGSQKPLNRVEIILACWRLQKMMYTEREIANMLYHQLGRFTGNNNKAFQASQLAGAARDEFLKSWLHGTLGNFILAVGTMGEYVRDQFLLTELKGFRPLTPDEEKRHVVTIDRTRVRQLVKAKTADGETSEGWTADKGGAEFNALIEKWIREDKGDAPADSGAGKKKFSTDQMKAAADTMSSKLRLAFLRCSGNLPDAQGGELLAADTEYARIDKVFQTLRAHVDQVADVNVKALLNAVLLGQPADVEKAFGPFGPSGSTVNA